ncbi:MAG: DUF1841 family protein [Proteobacteria bacterium]|nr:DUF1841 family protein [Pseudomonadota bacterium]
MFGDDRHELRQMYADAWRKRCNEQALSPLEAQIADVVESHPEYHDAVSSDVLDKDYTPEGGQSNPFLHMGLHLGIREQVATNRPAGIASVYKTLAARSGDTHAAEHQMIDCLAETLWEAQSCSAAADESQYLQQLRRLTR